MLANTDIYRIKTVTAEALPETCTACPFWGLEMQEMETGSCLITGTQIKTDGQQDSQRMTDCPMTKKKKGPDGKLVIAYALAVIMAMVAAAGWGRSAETPKTAETPVSGSVVIHTLDGYAWGYFGEITVETDSAGEPWVELNNAWLVGSTHPYYNPVEPVQP